MAVRFAPLRWATALAMAVVVMAGCGGEGGGPPAATPRPGPGSDVPENIFKNGGFEQGEAPWISLRTENWGPPFRLTDEVAHGGRYSALLELRAPKEGTGPRVFGVVQEVRPPQFPEIVSGYYRVNSWHRGTAKQYLQFVVIVFGSTNLARELPNHQIRYLLAGISEPPFRISNAKFVFVATGEPRAGEWIYFERPIQEDFRQAWTAVPEGFSFIRILFEVRYDDKAFGSQFEADVAYDDLYMGPAAANPNSPEGAWRRNHGAGHERGKGGVSLAGAASGLGPRENGADVPRPLALESPILAPIAAHPMSGF